MNELTPEPETTTCAECGSECLDPDSGVGIRRGDDPICGDCAAGDYEHDDDPDGDGWRSQ